MQETLSTLSTYGYMALFLYSLGGGMVAVIAAGVLSHMGKMDISLSIFIAFSANAIGDNILFYLSRYNKAEIFPYIRKHRRKFALSHVLMKRYGDKIIFFQKFVYGIKTLIPLAIGLTSYSYARFTVINIVSALIWATLLGYGSYEFGEIFSNVVSFIVDRPYFMPLIVLPFLGFLWWYLQRYAKKKKV